MKTVYVNSSVDLGRLIDLATSMQNSGRYEIRVTGTLYPDLSRSYVGWGKYNTARIASLTARSVAAGGVALSVMTLGMGAPGGMAAVAASAAAMAVEAAAKKEFETNAFAAEIIKLQNLGCVLIRNEPPYLILGRS